VSWDRRGVIAALLASAAAAACTGISTDPQFPLSIQFDSLPAQAVVVGDTMRGGDQLPARIALQAFNSSGATVSDSQLRLVGIDTTSASAFNVISGLRIVGKVVAPAVRVVGQAGAVQSQTQTFAVVPAPTAISRLPADSADSLIYNRSDTSLQYVDTRVRIVAGSTLLSGLRVRFTVVSATDSIVDSVRLMSSSGRVTSSVLLNAGDATVRVKAYRKAAARGRGVVTLEASIRAKGVDVPGSPLRFPIRLVPTAP
jgi:hypothetical protein